MSIQPGDTIPDTAVQCIDGDIQPAQTAALFAGRKVLLFGVPGAFTPTCSNRHLPGYSAHFAEFRQRGIDVMCLAVNDGYVMQAWAASQQVPDGLLMLADGNASFTRALGLELDGSAQAVLIAEEPFADGAVVEALYTEEPDATYLSRITGMAVQRKKAVVGQNAFAHESGIHQHGMLKHRGTYEIMRPQDVGIAETKLVLGKHSGRAALRQRLQALGHEPDEAAMDDIFARFKALADKKREIHDEDLEAIALGQDPEALGPWQLVQLSTSTHLGGSASATVKLRHADGREAGESAIGDGPVDAVLRAIERVTGSTLDVTEFQVRAVSAGGDAQGQAQLTARHGKRDWRGHGMSTDIVEATAQAALAIVNRIERQAPAAAPVVVAHL